MPDRRHRSAHRAEPGPGQESVWDYPRPARAEPDRVAVYAEPFDEITLDGEQVRPQPGGFYGGWITHDVVGPFKGEAGSAHW
jgi:hypothetical protein